MDALHRHEYDACGMCVDGEMHERLQEHLRVVADLQANLDGQLAATERMRETAASWESAYHKEVDARVRAEGELKGARKTADYWHDKWREVRLRAIAAEERLAPLTPTGVDLLTAAEARVDTITAELEGARDWGETEMRRGDALAAEVAELQRQVRQLDLGCADSNDSANTWHASLATAERAKEVMAQVLGETSDRLSDAQARAELLAVALAALRAKADQVAAERPWDWKDHACPECVGLAVVGVTAFRCARHDAAALSPDGADGAVDAGGG
jgi:hypothetical protein